jgi:hypothetical protein
MSSLLHEEKADLDESITTLSAKSVSVSVLKDGEPTSNRIFHGHIHFWELKRQEDAFSVVCRDCHTAIRGWKLPRTLLNVLDAAAKLDLVCANGQAGKKWKLSETDLRAAVSLLNLPSRSRSERSKIWDVYATLHILLSLKAGRERGSLVVKSKVLTRLIEVSMYPDRLKGMPVSSRKRYKFVVDAIMMLPARLS